MARLIDLVGLRFGRWSVVERAENGRYNKVRFLCLCDCGKSKIVGSQSLRKGESTSCGCYQMEITSKTNMLHGDATVKNRSRLYKIWAGMLGRCNNKNHVAYKNYGGRGVTVCPEWRDFSMFKDWAVSNGYLDELTIERKNNDFGYSPKNCEWVSRTTQNNNTRRNHLITLNGKTQTLAQWAKEVGVNYKTLHSRIVNYGWSAEKALALLACGGEQ